MVSTPCKFDLRTYSIYLSAVSRLRFVFISKSKFRLQEFVIIQAYFVVTMIKNTKRSGMKREAV